MTKKEIKIKNYIKEEIKKVLREEEEEEIALPADPDIEKELKTAFDQATNLMKSQFTAIAKDVGTKMKDETEVQTVLDDNPELKKLATESVRRRRSGTLTEEQLNEEIGFMFITGMIMAAPAIVTLIGKAVTALSKVLGTGPELGKTMEHWGHKMHAAYITGIQKLLSVMPGTRTLPADKQKQIATLIHMIIILSCAIYGGATVVGHVIQGFKAASLPLTFTEAIVTAIKSKELTDFLKITILKIAG